MHDLINKSRHQIRILPRIFGIYLFTTLVLVILLAISEWSGISVASFMRDPNAIAKLPPFAGIMSNIGILLWGGTVALCLFCASKNPSQRSFLTWAAGLTALLLMDDLFQFHEALIPTYLGIPESITFAFYGALMLCFLVWFIDTIAETEFLILGAAFACFGLSLVFDMWIPGIPHQMLIEDGFKLFGIVSWTLYFARLCSQSLEAHIALAAETAQIILSEPHYSARSKISAQSKDRLGLLDELLTRPGT